jgi:sarcosine oxidase/L-pipecolate oxidase
MGNSYIIVGSGVMGASTAYHLQKAYPQASISIFDQKPFPSTHSASWDYNKLIRTEYLEEPEKSLAIEAERAWKSDIIFSPFLRKSPLLWIPDVDTAKSIATLNGKNGARLLGVDDAKAIHGGVFKDANYTDISDVLYNESSGWAEAKDALECLIEAAVGMGVEYKEDQVLSLDITGEVCRGVKTASGQTYRADFTVLCTGAGTEKLLANTSSDWEELQTSGRLKASGISMGIATPSNSEMAVSPICLQDAPSCRGNVCS